METEHKILNEPKEVNKREDVMDDKSDHEESFAILEEEAFVTIGELLRTAREAKKLSLEVIAQHTKINLSLLQALEEDRLSELPNKAYVMGFVKSYSKAVNLNLTECIEILEETYLSKNQLSWDNAVIPGKINVSPYDKTKAPGISVPIILGIGLIAVITIGATLFFTRTTSPEIKNINTTKVTPIVVLSPAKKLTPTVKTPESSVKTKTLASKLLPKVVTKRKSKPASLTAAKSITVPATKTKTTSPSQIKAQELTKPVKKVLLTPKKAKVTKELKANNKEITFSKFSLPLYQKTGMTKNLKEFLPAKFASNIISGKQNVFINAALGDTWITYKSDDLAIRKFILRKGRTLMIRGEVIRIFLGNINVTRIFLNNQPLKISSRSGVKSIIFPQEKSSDFKIPLFVYKDSGVVQTSTDYIKENKL